LTQCSFETITQHHSQDQRCGGEIELAHKISKQAEQAHHPNIKNTAVDAIDADHGNSQYKRVKNVIGEAQDLGEKRHQRNIQN
jgi:hypothetical protein